MNQDFTCDCGREIGELECNSCRTREFAFQLSQKGLDTNTLTHVVREIKKTVDDENGEVICQICNQNLVSMCRSCYFSKIRKLVYFNFPQDVSDRVLSFQRR